LDSFEVFVVDSFIIDAEKFHGVIFLFNFDDVSLRDSRVTERDVAPLLEVVIELKVSLALMPRNPSAPIPTE
jgi:hypothetical protein